MTKPQDDSLWRPVRFKKPPRVGSTGGLSGVGFLGGADRHIRRGGSGVMWCGDACVALAGGERRSREGDEGDAQHKASPPHTLTCPHNFNRRVRVELPGEP